MDLAHDARHETLIALRDSAFGLDAEALESLIAGEPRLESAPAVADEMRGILAYKRRDTDEALPLLARAAAAEGHQAHRNSLLFLMRGDFARGETAGAIEHARQVLAIDPAHLEALRLIARGHLREKDWEAAEAAFADTRGGGAGEPETIAQRMRIAGPARRLRGPDPPRRPAAGADAGRTRGAAHGDRRARAGRRFEGVERLLPSLAKVDPEAATRRLTPLRGADQALVKARTVRNLITAGFEGRRRRSACPTSPPTRRRCG